MSFLQDERLAQVSDPAIAALLRDLLHGQSELLKRVSDIEGELQKQAAASAAVVAAFPNGDMAGHCRYHELMIEDIESRKRLRRAITEKTLGGLLWGTMAMVAAAVWFYIKAQVMR